MVQSRNANDNGIVLVINLVLADVIHDSLMPDIVVIQGQDQSLHESSGLALNQHRFGVLGQN